MSWLSDLTGVDVDLLDPNAQVAAAISAAVAFVVGYYFGVPMLGMEAGLSTAVTYAGFTYATTLTTIAVTKALMPPDKTQQQDQGYLVTQRGSTLPHQILYGKTRVAGGIVFQAVTDNNKYLHTVLAFTGHEIEEFETIYFNDEILTLSGNSVTSPSKYVGKVKIVKKLGTTTQTSVTASDLGGSISLPEKWTSDAKLLGVSYLYVTLEFDPDVFPTGFPEITAIIKGKKVYDPRTSTTAWSDNPALIMRDYITSGKEGTNTSIYTYGVGEDLENVDDTLVSTAANVCDYLNYPTLSGGTRYTCNGAFTTNSVPHDVLQNLSTSMGGLLWYSQGKWRMKPAYFTNSVLDLNEDDLRSAISVRTRHSRRDNFNVVRGTFRGPESDYQPSDYPQVPVLNSTTYNELLEADGGQESVVDISLPFTDNTTEARRLSRIALERNRQQLTIEATFGLRALKVQVGDTVRLSSTRFGFTNKEFEVSSWGFSFVPNGDLGISMTLREISSSVFDEVDDGAIYERDNTTLVTAFDVPSISLSTSQDYRVINEHVVNVLVIDVNSTSPERIDYVEVQYKKATDTNYKSLGTGELGSFEIIDIDVPNIGEAGIIYDIRARAVNAIGIRSNFADNAIQVTAEYDSTGPDAPVGFTKQLSGSSFFLKWNASTALDLSYYKIYHSSSTIATFTDGSKQVMIEKVARPATSVAFPAITGTVFIEPYDKVGNGGSPASLTITSAELPPLGNTLTDTESPSFSGTKTNVAIETSTNPDELRLSNYTTAPSTGTYEFTGYLEPSPAAVRTVRVSHNLASIRHNEDAVSGETNWDDIPGNWNTWPDNWDTWTNENANYGDTNVLIFVAATSDDPSGTPTWGDWVPASGDIVGRAFKFKAELESNTDNVTPTISVLEGIIQYDT